MSVVLVRLVLECHHICCYYTRQGIEKVVTLSVLKSVLEGLLWCCSVPLLVLGATTVVNFSKSLEGHFMSC